MGSLSCPRRLSLLSGKGSGTVVCAELLAPPSQADRLPRRVSPPPSHNHLYRKRTGQPESLIKQTYSVHYYPQVLEGKPPTEPARKWHLSESLICALVDKGSSTRLASQPHTNPPYRQNDWQMSAPSRSYMVSSHPKVSSAKHASGRNAMHHHLARASVSAVVARLR